MFLLFRDRDWMRVEKVADGSVAADQDELLEGRARPALFEQPKQPLNCNVDNVVRHFFARCAVQHMRDAIQSSAHYGTIRDIALDNFQRRARIQKPVVAQRPDARIFESFGTKDALYNIAPDLAGRASDQDLHRSFRRSALILFWCN